MRKSVSLAKVESMIDNAQVRKDDRKHGTNEDQMPLELHGREY